MKKYILFFSIFLNILFILFYIVYKINSPTNELGILRQNICVKKFATNDTLFVIPKGITVSDVSEQGLAAIGQFENNRFSIVITTDEDLIDYEINKDSLNLFGNYYSSEIIDNKKNK